MELRIRGMVILVHPSPQSRWTVFDMLTWDARRRYYEAIGRQVMASRRTELFLQVKSAIRDAQAAGTQVTDDELAERFGVREGERAIITEARRDLAADSATMTVQNSVQSQVR